MNEAIFAPGQIRQSIPPGQRDFFIYPAEFGSIAAAANATVNIAISADSDFYLTALTLFATLAGAAQTEATQVAPQLLYQIVDTGSGRQLFNSSVPAWSIAGDGKRPFRLIHPRLFKRSTTINVTATNFSAAETYSRSWLNFVGFKLYTN
ncbi:MAG: hypothetical protein AB7P97_20380 [Hyphomonadaceae bacterium]